MNTSSDVLIIGAGAAGLIAARELSIAGMRVLVVEARDRIGGRILTHLTPDYPVELGAEFVHGRPPEIGHLVQEACLELAEIEWNVKRRKGNRWLDGGDLMSGVDRLLEKLPSDQPDQSFQDFIDRSDSNPEIKEMALRFVEGFHAADPRRIGVHSLIRSNAADERVDADHQYRFAQGYEGLVKTIANGINWRSCELRLSTEVKQVQWKRGQSQLKTASGEELRAPRCLVAVPLGVLKAGGIRFDPALPEKEKALQGLEMGPVIRASLCFRDKFWEAESPFRKLSFLFTDDPRFPTWWTSHPLPFPIITGWASGHYARGLSQLKAEQVIDCALQSLANIFALEVERLRRDLQAGFTHDWPADPFSCGAYSYAVMGGSDAGRELGAPVAGTLFFAGEATDSDGQNGTVHGAIASGLRAAKEILAADQRR